MKWRMLSACLVGTILLLGGCGALFGINDPKDWPDPLDGARNGFNDAKDSLDPVDDADSGTSPPAPPPPDATADTASPADPADADAAPLPPAPPVVSPVVWLDARKIPAAITSLRTWNDSTANGADATSQVALSVDRGVLAGRPGVILVGDSAQALSIPAAKIPAFRTYSSGGGFAVFMVASFEDGAAPRTAHAVLFERTTFQGVPPNVQRYGIELSLDSSLTTLNGALQSYSASGPQVTTTASGAAPAKNVPHLFVLSSTAGSLSLRVDGREIQKVTGFVENNFYDNRTLPFNIGAYSGTTSGQFALIGAVGMVAVYTRALSDANVTAGEVAAKAAWGIP